MSGTAIALSSSRAGAGRVPVGAINDRLGLTPSAPRNHKLGMLHGAHAKFAGHLFERLALIEHGLGHFLRDIGVGAVRGLVCRLPLGRPPLGREGLPTFGKPERSLNGDLADAKLEWRSAPSSIRADHKGTARSEYDHPWSSASSAVGALRGLVYRLPLGRPPLGRLGLSIIDKLERSRLIVFWLTPSWVAICSCVHSRSP